MSDWRKQLQPASFKGVPFEVLSDSSTFGRRIQVHEFVQRDQPYCEDLGRITRRFSVNAFFGGDDCLDKRDAFLAAIDEDATGELVLPTWGAMQATALPGSVDTSREDGGVVWISLEFVESGDKGYPVATPATDAQLGDAAGGVLDAGSNWFTDAMGAVDTARVNIAAMTSSVAAAYGLVTGTIGTITRTVASAADLANMVLNAPANFVLAVRASVGSVRTSLSGIDPAQALSSLRSAAGNSRSMGYVNPAGGAHTVAAVQAVNELARSAALTVALDAASQLPVQRATAPAMALPVWQQAAQALERPLVLYAPDVLAARDVLDAALWDALQGGNGRPPLDVLKALQDARVKARRHLAQAAGAAVPTVQITPPAMLPALVLAHRQWGDATRAAEIVQRNRLRHPGFVPPQPLQVARE
ncbi:DNA circularization protein [Comamonas aquatica]|uniref:DNA circularization N-terminal domain-containing protein n=1 Tax=Comamonas aquatica TaxID=225991 RepID=A0AA42HRD5_9BURK|nr:DNA circularization N-terminal domain-containing protein [Comamonas aquatica]MDH0362788.1 DNA circularization N-terminal domain-containing protein [Comamonas aquatica]